MALSLERCQHYNNEQRDTLKVDGAAGRVVNYSRHLGTIRSIIFSLFFSSPYFKFPSLIISFLF